MRILVIAIGLLGCAGYAAFWTAERYPEHVPALVELTAPDTVAGAVTYVRDGDTIEVDGVPIRFGSLDCPEATYAEGADALKFMRQLVIDENLTCFLNGRSSYDRKIGSCRLSDGRDMGEIMISEGYCSRFW